MAITKTSSAAMDHTAVASEFVPRPGLGANFEKKTFAHLTLSTKSLIWGAKINDVTEPTATDVPNGLRQKALTRDSYHCQYCGFLSYRNEIHSRNDNHRDIREENLCTADALCHDWHHLGELGDKNAVIAFLPGLSARDANHLQRTLMVALNLDDPKVRRDAKVLLNWMASHRDYVKSTWGSSNPSAFASALVKLGGVDLECREIAFEDLAIVFNPVRYNTHATAWMKESYGAFPVGDWGKVYHNVMHAPA